MLDNLEQHIRDNREALDTQVPDYDRLWKGIEGQLPQQEAKVLGMNARDESSGRKVYRIAKKPEKKRSLWKREPLIRWAASIIVAVSVGTGWNFLHTPIGPMGETQVAKVEPPKTTQSGLPAEFANMEAYYRDAINQHQSQLVAYHEEGISLDNRFAIDLDQLQTSYKSLQAELVVSESPEVVIDAMVQNLTMQLDIVQQQLRILETIKKAQQTSNDAVQI